MLSLAGINPDKRTTECMVAFAAKGVPPTMSRKRRTGYDGLPYVITHAIFNAW